MLDKLTSKILESIVNLCNDDGYKVLSLQDISANLPKKYNLANDTLKSNISYLSNHEYIEIKYMEGDVVCLRLLPKSRIYFEDELDYDRQYKATKKLIIISIIVNALVSIGISVATLILVR